MPYVGQLIASGLAVAGTGREAGVLSSVLDQLPANVLLVSRECRLVFANLGARRLLALHDGLLVAGPFLTASDPATNAVLKRAVVQALGVMGNNQLTVGVERPSGCAPFEVTVLQLNAAPTAIGRFMADERIAMLVIRQTDPGIAVDQASVMHYFGLTGKEGDVAVLMCRGHGLRVIAGMLGMSYNTVRYHLRHIFEKTSSNRQSDLVRRIIASSFRDR